MEMKTVSDPEITADGSKVAYVVRGVDARRNAYSSEIWIVAATGGRGQRLASPQESNAHPRWAGDSRTLGFLSHRDGVTQIYVVSTPEATPRRLTDSPTDITEFQWSPDSRYIGYLAADPNPDRERQRRRGDDAIVGGEGYTSTRLHILPAGGGQERTVTASAR